MAAAAPAGHEREGAADRQDEAEARPAVEGTVGRPGGLAGGRAARHRARKRRGTVAPSRDVLRPRYTRAAWKVPAPLQLELLVSRALERQAMQGRDAEPLDGVAVLGRRVADVLGEAPAGVQAVGAVHEAVARDLGDDRRRGDRRALGVAVDDRALRPLELLAE